MPESKPVNPIPFNPDTMTVSQLKECAEVLSRMFDGIAREVPADNMMFHLKQARDDMANRWGKK